MKVGVAGELAGPHDVAVDRPEVFDGGEARDELEVGVVRLSRCQLAGRSPGKPEIVLEL